MSNEKNQVQVFEQQHMEVFQNYQSTRTRKNEQEKQVKEQA